MARQTHVELVVTSPMARAIQTATLAFAHVSRQASAPTEYCCEYCRRLPQWRSCDAACTRMRERRARRCRSSHTRVRARRRTGTSATSGGAPFAIAAVLSGAPTVTPCGSMRQSGSLAAHSSVKRLCPARSRRRWRSSAMSTSRQCRWRTKTRCARDGARRRASWRATSRCSSSALWRTHADRVPRPMDVHTARTARLRVHGVARASTRGRDRRV